MKIPRVVFNNVVWRQIDAAAKPAHGLPSCYKRRWQFKIANVHVNDGNHRVIRVYYDGYARSKKIILVHLQRVFKRFGQPAMHGRKIYPSFFKYIAILNDPGTTPAPAITLPQLLFKFRLAVQLLERCADFILDLLIVGSYL